MNLRCDAFQGCLILEIFWRIFWISKWSYEMVWVLYLPKAPLGSPKWANYINQRCIITVPSTFAARVEVIVETDVDGFSFHKHFLGVVVHLTQVSCLWQSKKKWGVPNVLRGYNNSSVFGPPQNIWLGWWVNWWRFWVAAFLISSRPWWKDLLRIAMHDSVHKNLQASVFWQHPRTTDSIRYVLQGVSELIIDVV